MPAWRAVQAATAAQGGSRPLRSVSELRGTTTRDDVIELAKAIKAEHRVSIMCRTGARVDGLGDMAVDSLWKAEPRLAQIVNLAAAVCIDNAKNEKFMKPLRERGIWLAEMDNLLEACTKLRAGVSSLMVEDLVSGQYPVLCDEASKLPEGERLGDLRLNVSDEGEDIVALHRLGIRLGDFISILALRRESLLDQAEGRTPSFVFEAQPRVSVSVVVSCKPPALGSFLGRNGEKFSAQPGEKGFNLVVRGQVTEDEYAALVAAFEEDADLAAVCTLFSESNIRIILPFDLIQAAREQRLF
ncbi:MAG: hypothetical protein WC901_03585 [Candidatus Margulisiibacteriota bacterium]